MGIRIRRAATADVAEIREVAQRTWAFAYQELIPADVQTSLVSRWYSDDARERRMERGILLVAESAPGQAIVGFINTFRNPGRPGEVALAAIYVLPDHEGHGIGTALLCRALAGMPDALRVVAQVEKGNTVGLNFYRARGFDPVREMDDEVADGIVLRTVEVVRSLPRA